MDIIDWFSEDSAIFINPSHTESEKKLFSTLLDESKHLPSHFWLATSGSITMKWVGLSKQAILTSAQAVNEHLECSSADRWALALPKFHVGGLGVLARGFIAGAKVYDINAITHGKWHCQKFYDGLSSLSVTLTALVPAQLFDLVCMNYSSPPSLRAVVIGGGSLEESLYQRALSLGWNVLPSYGLTECASQVATAPMKKERESSMPRLKILSHVHVSEVQGRLKIKSPSLLSTYAIVTKEGVLFEDPKCEGAYLSDDYGSVSEGLLSIEGRRENFVKIGGESVNLAQLEEILQNIRLEFNVFNPMTLFAYPDSRLGHVIHLVMTENSRSHYLDIAERFNQRVLPFTKIRQVHFLPYLPQTALSKVLKGELSKMIIGVV